MEYKYIFWAAYFLGLMNQVAGSEAKIYSTLRRQLDGCKSDLTAAQPAGAAVQVEPLKKAINQLCAVAPVDLVKNFAELVAQLETAGAQASASLSAEGKAAKQKLEDEQRRLQFFLEQEQEDQKNALINRINEIFIQCYWDIENILIKLLESIPAKPEVPPIVVVEDAQKKMGTSVSKEIVQKALFDQVMRIPSSDPAVAAIAESDELGEVVFDPDTFKTIKITGQQFDPGGVSASDNEYARPSSYDLPVIEFTQFYLQRGLYEGYIGTVIDILTAINGKVGNLPLITSRITVLRGQQGELTKLEPDTRERLNERKAVNGSPIVRFDKSDAGKRSAEQVLDKRKNLVKPILGAIKGYETLRRDAIRRKMIREAAKKEAALPASQLT